MSSTLGPSLRVLRSRRERRATRVRRALSRTLLWLLMRRIQKPADEVPAPATVNPDEAETQVTLEPAEAMLRMLC